MDTIQNALINHLEESGLFKTVKPYAGEFKEASKVPTIIPAALVVCTSAAIEQNKMRAGFDVLVVSENKAFDRAKSLTSNLKLAGDCLRYCNDRLFFNYNGEQFIYNRDVYQTQESDHPFTVSLVMQDNRFTIHAIHLSILKII